VVTVFRIHAFRDGFTGRLAGLDGYCREVTGGPMFTFTDDGTLQFMNTARPIRSMGISRMGQDGASDKQTILSRPREGA
jgi:hypothetical protein